MACQYLPCPGKNTKTSNQLFTKYKGESEPSQTSKMDLFAKKKSIDYFCKKTPSRMFHWVLNTHS